MRKAFIFASLLASVSLNTANAEEDWNGFYAGILSGYSAGALHGSNVAGTSASTTFLEGGIFGATAGVNYQIDQFVLGVESDVAWSGIDGSNPCVSSPTQTCSANLNWIGTVRGRVGYSFDSIMLFATAGVAVGSGTSTTSPASAGSTGTDTQIFAGWTVGVGGEYALTDSLSIKADYLATDLGSRTAPVGTVSSTSAFVGNPITHTVRLGLNYRF